MPYPFVTSRLVLELQMQNPSPRPMLCVFSQALALFRGRDSGPSRSVAAFLRNLSEGHHGRI